MCIIIIVKNIASYIILFKLTITKSFNLTLDWVHVFQYINGQIFIQSHSVRMHAIHLLLAAIAALLLWNFLFHSLALYRQTTNQKCMSYCFVCDAFVSETAVAECFFVCFARRFSRLFVKSFMCTQSQLAWYREQKDKKVTIIMR